MHDRCSVMFENGSSMRELPFLQKQVYSGLLFLSLALAFVSTCVNAKALFRSPAGWILRARKHS